MIVYLLGEAMPQVKYRLRYRGSKKMGSAFVPYPEPRMDWFKLRLAKLRCETCGQFNKMMGGCQLNLLPGECL